VKHSKSPWRFDDAFSLPIVVDGEGRVVADVRMKHPYSEALANGKVLAGADKLLATSKELLLELEKFDIELKAASKLKKLLLELTEDPKYGK